MPANEPPSDSPMRDPVPMTDAEWEPFARATGIEPPSDSIPPDEVLPCGCLIRCVVINGTNTLTVSPCRQSCPNLANLLDLGRDKGIAPEYRRA